MTWGEAANLAVNQTLMRSINTSVIALLPVAGLLFVGAGLLGVGTLKDLALVLFVGLAAGAYSSIFLATPIVADLKEREPEVRSRCASGSWPAARRRRAHRRRRPRPAGPVASARRAAPGARRPRRWPLAERDLPGQVEADVVVESPSSVRPGAAAAGRRRRRGPGARPQRPGAKGRAVGQEAPVSTARPARRTPAVPLDELIAGLAVDVPDFPEPGVLFRDLTPVFADGAGVPARWSTAWPRRRRPTRGRPPSPRAGGTSAFDVVVGVEARGFLLAAAVALRRRRRASSRCARPASCRAQRVVGRLRARVRDGDPGAARRRDPARPAGARGRRRAGHRRHARAAIALVERLGGVVAAVSVVIELPRSAGGSGSRRTPCTRSGPPDRGRPRPGRGPRGGAARLAWGGSALLSPAGVAVAPDVAANAAARAAGRAARRERRRAAPPADGERHGPVDAPSAAARPPRRPPSRRRRLRARRRRRARPAAACRDRLARRIVAGQRSAGRPPGPRAAGRPAPAEPPQGRPRAAAAGLRRRRGRPRRAEAQERRPVHHPSARRRHHPGRARHGHHDAGRGAAARHGRGHRRHPRVDHRRLRLRGRAPRRRRHQDRQGQARRRRPGRDDPQDDRRDGPRPAGAGHQAGRPAAQHAHAALPPAGEAGDRRRARRWRSSPRWPTGWA